MIIICGDADHHSPGKPKFAKHDNGIIHMYEFVADNNDDFLCIFLGGVSKFLGQFSNEICLYL